MGLCIRVVYCFKLTLVEGKGRSWLPAIETGYFVRKKVSRQCCISCSIIICYDRSPPKRTPRACATAFGSPVDILIHSPSFGPRTFHACCHHSLLFTPRFWCVELFASSAIPCPQRRACVPDSATTHSRMLRCNLVHTRCAFLSQTFEDC